MEIQTTKNTITTSIKDCHADGKGTLEPEREEENDVFNEDDQYLVCSCCKEESHGISCDFDDIGRKDYGGRVKIKKEEYIDVYRLRKLIWYCQQHDPANYEKILFMDQCFPERHKRLQMRYVKVPIEYCYSSKLRSLQMARVYAYATSHFQYGTKKHNSLQNLPRNYRSYLCYHSYWDVDMKNAHPSILLSLLTQENTNANLDHYIPVPPLLEEYVTQRKLVYDLIHALFDPESQNKIKFDSMSKNLMLRLMYGGRVAAWFSEHKLSAKFLSPEYDEEQVLHWILSNNITLPREAILKCPKLCLLKQLLDFPSQLRRIAKRLRALPRFAKIPGDLSLMTFLSIALQDVERYLLFEADNYMAQNSAIGRGFDVYIHDGGLVRKTSPFEDQSEFEDLLCQLNEFVTAKLNFPYIQFILKPFDELPDLFSLIEQQSSRQVEYSYDQWKYYMETHRDLCYISKNQRWYFADNLQTNVYEKFSALRYATSAYRLASHLIPGELTGAIMSLEDGRESPSNQKTRKLLRQPSSEFVTPDSANILFGIDQSIANLDERIIAPDSGKKSSVSSIHPDQSASQANTYVKPSPAKKLVQFVDVWQQDPEKREYCMTYFSEKTWEKDGLLTKETPTELEGTYDAAIRYLFQGWDLLEKYVPASSTIEHVDENDNIDKYYSVTEQGLRKKITTTKKEYSPDLFLRLMHSLFPNAEAFSYVLSWVAHIFQYPDERLGGTCLVLVAREQGTGKSTFAEAILDLTKRFGRKIGNVEEELFGTFTAALEHNLLLLLDDNSSKLLRKHYESLKRVITDERARVRELYTKERYVVTNARFVVVSNNPECLELENCSRRFSVFGTKSTLSGNFDFWTDWKVYWAQEGNRAAVMHFLVKTHRIPKGWNPEKSYSDVTRMKQTMEEATLSILQTYLYSLSLAELFEQSLASCQDTTQKCFYDVQSKELLVKVKAFAAIHYPTENDRKRKKRDEVPNHNTFPSSLESLGIYNTRELPEGGHKYRAAQFYRIPISDFAIKAHAYRLDPLENGLYPTNGHILMFDTASSELGDKNKSQKSISKRKVPYNQLHIGQDHHQRGAEFSEESRPFSPKIIDDKEDSYHSDFYREGSKRVKKDLAPNTNDSNEFISKLSNEALVASMKEAMSEGDVGRLFEAVKEMQNRKIVNFKESSFHIV